MNPHPLEIRFADIDVAGHVNNAVYLSYFEQGRIRFFEDVIGLEWDWDKHGIIVARNEIDYLQPVHLNDEVYITASIGNVGNKSFQMNMRIFKKVNETEIDCALGLVTVVCFDYQQKKTIPVPASWRKLASKLQP